MNKRKVFRFVLVAFHILCLALLAGTACGPSDDEKLSGLWEFSGGINGSPKLSLLENCDYKIFRYSADFSKTIYLDRGKWALDSGKLVMITRKPGAVSRLLSLSKEDIDKVIRQRTGVDRPKWMKPQEFLVAVDYRIMSGKEHRDLLLREGRLRLLEEPSWRDWFKPETHPEGYLRLISPSGKSHDFFQSASYGRFTKCRF